jgi:acetate---CoA ligase (ADP-forming)
VLEDVDVDAALAVFTETLVAGVDDVLRAVSDVAAETGKPVVVTHTGGEPRTPDDPGGDRRALPIFEFPEPAAAALGLAWRYAQIRSTPVPEPTRPRDVDTAGARALLAERLATHTEWLGPEDASRLLARYGIPLCPQRVVADLHGAVRAAGELGYPVAVKLAGAAVHKTDVGGVWLDVRDESELHEAFTAVHAAADRAQVLIQPMVAAGTELIIGAIQDRQFGPVVMVGAGGVLTDLVSDRHFRLAPIAPPGIDQMLGGLGISRLLDGYRGQPPVSRRALTDLLVRVSAFADDLPAVAELDLNPVICLGDELVVVDPKVRIAPVEQAPDPILRQLRPARGGANHAG